MTTEELIEHGLPTFMNEFVNWQLTEKTQSVGHLIKKQGGTYKAVPNVQQAWTNFDNWLRGILKNFTYTDLGPVNNDGSRTLTRQNAELRFYFNEDGSVKHVDQVSPALLNQYLIIYGSKVPADVLALACTSRTEFTQKEPFQITSILPDLDFDGINVLNDTKVDGVHWATHPNLPANHAWRYRFMNADDRSGGMDELVVIVSPQGVTGRLKKFGDVEQNVSVLPEVVNGFTIAHTDEASEIGYDPMTNIYWFNPDLQIAEAQIEMTMDTGLFKADGSISEIISLK